MPKDLLGHSFPSSRRAAVFLALAAALLSVPRALAQTAPLNPILAPLPDAPSPQPDEPASSSRQALPERFYVPQTQTAQPQSTASGSGRATLGVLPRGFLHDQGMIWSSPASLHTRDLEWLLPLAGAEGIAFKTDRCTMKNVVSHDPKFNKVAINASNILITGWMAAPIGIWSYGHVANDYHATETGVLATESILDGLVVQQVLKWVFRRERPNADDARGRFFRHGVGSNSSFPSSHSLLSWCASSAIAAETHSHWAQAGLYAGSGSVALLRVFGQRHFPSDVLAGSSLGWLIGHNVVVRRHVDVSAAAGDR